MKTCRITPRCLRLRILVLAMLVFEGAGIRCYVCSGTKAYCDAKSFYTECSIKYFHDTCYKEVPYNSTDDRVTKLCHTRGDCSRARQRCLESRKCEVFCCYKDLCNGGLDVRPGYLWNFAITISVVVWLHKFKN